MLEEETSNEIEARLFAAELRGDALPQLDLHQVTGDIESKIDIFLTDTHEDAARIVYGIGKGVMKKTVLEFLRKHPNVDYIKEEVGSCLVLLEKEK